MSTTTTFVQRYASLWAVRPILLALLLVGLAFLSGALVVLRMGRYPRSDGYGAVLLGAILSALGGFVLFVRVWAMTHG